MASALDANDLHGPAVGSAGPDRGRSGPGSQPSGWDPPGVLRAALVTVVASLAAVGPAHAQAADTVPLADAGPGSDTVPGPDTVALPGIVVTATRVPLPREALPTPVSAWTGDELRARGIETVAEALASLPAATVARAGAPGAQTSLFLRGGESDYVKVLVDGVAVNDPGGGFDFADLSTDQVERIEVVRGPVSVLYGSDAVAGVVQVFTRRGLGAPVLTAELTGGWGRERGPAGSAATDGRSSLDVPSPGTYGVMDAEATVTGSTGSVAYTVGGARSWSGGLYPVNSERGHSSGTARVAWTSQAGTELAVSTRYTDSRSRFPTDGAGALVDANARLERTAWTTSVAAGFALHHRVEARIQAGLATRARRSVDRTDGPADTLGTFASELEWDLARRSIDIRLDADLPRSVLSGGVAWEEAEATSAYASRSAFGPLTADADYRRTTRGYYLQLLSEPVDRLHVTLGGRLDESDTYGAFQTFRVGLAVQPAPGTRLRTALGRGFREPAFDQVFGSGFGDVGNPQLEPERSRSWEVGIEQTLGPATLSATWFDQRYERMIQYTFVPPDEGAPNYFNVGAASSRGLELEARARRGRFGVAASYTYLATEVLDPGLATDAGFVEGEPLLRRPARSGALTARYRGGGGTVAATLTAVGEREDLDFGAGFPAPRVTLPGYATLDLAAERPLPLPGPDATLLLRVRNVLDTGYQSIAGFPGEGRVVRLGLRISL